MTAKFTRTTPRRPMQIRQSWRLTTGEIEGPRKWFSGHAVEARSRAPPGCYSAKALTMPAATPVKTTAAEASGVEAAPVKATTAKSSRRDSAGCSGKAAHGVIAEAVSDGSRTRSVEVVVAVEDPVVRRVPNHERRIEAPSKRAIKESRAWQECVSSEPGIPIPPRPPPSRPVPSIRVVQTRRVDVRLRQVLRSQAAPAIQIVVLRHLLFVEILGLEIVRVQRQGVPALHRRAAVVGRHDRLAVEYAHLLVGGVKIIQARFQDLGIRARLADVDKVLLVDLIHFQHRFAALQ